MDKSLVSCFLLDHGVQRKSVSNVDSGTTDLDSDPAHHQNPIDWSLGDPTWLQKISSKSVYKLLRYTAKCQFTPYLVMVKNPLENDPGFTKESWSTQKNNRWSEIIMYYYTIHLPSLVMISQWFLCYTPDTCKHTHVQSRWLLYYMLVDPPAEFFYYIRPADRLFRRIFG